MNKFFEEWLLIIIVGIIIFSLLIAIGFKIKEVCDCPLCVEPENFYLVENYSERDGFYYADVDDFKPVKHLGGGVLVWVK
jgi:hypothetical protein